MANPAATSWASITTPGEQTVCCAAIALARVYTGRLPEAVAWKHSPVPAGCRRCQTSPLLPGWSSVCCAGAAAPSHPALPPGAERS